MTAPAPRPVVVTLPDGAQVELHRDPTVRRGLVLRGPGESEALGRLRASVESCRLVHVDGEPRLPRSLELVEVRNGGAELDVRYSTEPAAPPPRVRRGS